MPCCNCGTAASLAAARFCCFCCERSFLCRRSTRGHGPARPPNATRCQSSCFCGSRTPPRRSAADLAPSPTRSLTWCWTGCCPSTPGGAATAWPRGWRSARSCGSPSRWTSGCGWGSGARPPRTSTPASRAPIGTGAEWRRRTWSGSQRSAGTSGPSFAFHARFASRRYQYLGAKKRGMYSQTHTSHINCITGINRRCNNCNSMNPE